MNVATSILVRDTYGCFCRRILIGPNNPRDIPLLKAPVRKKKKLRLAEISSECDLF